MVLFLILAALIAYIFIGGFLSGVFEYELSPTWVLAWPVLLLVLAVCVVAKIPVELGKKYYRKVDKWFADHI